MTRIDDEKVSYLVRLDEVEALVKEEVMKVEVATNQSKTLEGSTMWWDSSGELQASKLMKETRCCCEVRACRRVGFEANMVEEASSNSPCELRSELEDR